MTKFYLTLLLTFCVVPLGLAQENGTYLESFIFAGGGVISFFPSDDQAYRVQKEADAIFLNEAQRYVISRFPRNGEKLIIIPESEKKFLVDPLGSFWNDYLVKGRFNEESCLPTYRPFVPIQQSDVVTRGVKDGDVVEINGMEFQVYETPGLRQGGVFLYRATTDDMNTRRRRILTSNLFYEDGKIPNLYDLQGNFPEAEIGPYHGFMARAPQLIATLEKIRSLNTDPNIVPETWTSVLVNNATDAHPWNLADDSRTKSVDQIIDTLIARLRAVYRNYLSTSALWWYFGEKRMNASAFAILGEDFQPEQLDRMPQAETFENPDWLIGGSSATRNLSTTRMIRSETGDVFVMDVNSDREAQQIIDMSNNGEIGKVTGIFITHYHHDHNRGVPKLAEFFAAPVYGVEPLADILERPGAYRMPCLDQTVVAPVVRKNDGETMQWNEFELTFFDFPGQTLYHNALLVRRGADCGSHCSLQRPILFIGDSFTPTGIDDYCAWNRNLLQDGKGYLYCLEKIRNLDPSPMLVNAHVDPPFEFDTARLDYMEHALRERMVLLADLLAVPEINFGLDHAWCRLDPFVQTIPAGESTVLKMVITNHFKHACTFRVALEPDEAFPFEITPEPFHPNELTVAPGQEQFITWTITPRSDQIGKSFISAIVTTADGSLTGRCEAVIQTIGE